MTFTEAPPKLNEVDKDLEEFKYTVKTQAVAELTNYRGINDWGEVRYSDTCRPCV
jgi:hypothetical protein